MPNNATQQLKQLPISLGILLAALFSIPYLNPFGPSPIPTFYREWISAIICLAIYTRLLFEKGPRTEGIVLNLPYAIFIPLAALLIVYLQFLAGSLNYIEYLLLWCIYMMGAALALWTGLQLKTRYGLDNVLKVIAYALVVFAIISVSLQILQLLQLEKALFPYVMQKYTLRPYANLGQPNHLAVLLGCGVAASWYLFFAKKNWVLILTLVYLLIGMALTGSRMNWIFLVLFSLCMFAYLYRYEDKNKPKLWWLVLFIPLVYFVVIQLLNYFSGLFGFSTSDYTLRLHQGIREYRLNHWQDAWRMFLEHPILGVGFGNFSYYQFQYAGVRDFVEYSRNAHNLCLQILAELGAFGAVLIIGPLLALAVRLCFLKKSKEYMFVLFILMFFMVYSMLEYPLWYVYFLFPVALILGLCDFPVARFEVSQAMSKLKYLIVLLGVSLVVFIHYDYKKIDLFFGDDAITSGPVMLTNLEQADKSIFFKSYADFIRSFYLGFDPQKLPLIIAYQERVLKSFIGPNLLNNYIIALVLSRRYQDAEIILDKTRRFFPLDMPRIISALSKITQQNDPLLTQFIEKIEKQYNARLTNPAN